MQSDARCQFKFKKLSIPCLDKLKYDVLMWENTVKLVFLSRKIAQNMRKTKTQSYRKRLIAAEVQCYIIF